jgi:hypothetical protein
MADPREVPELKIRERPQSMLRNVDDRAPGGVRDEDLGAPTINAKKRRWRAPERCRSWPRVRGHAMPAEPTPRAGP